MAGHIPVDPCAVFSGAQFDNLAEANLTDTNPATGQRDYFGLAADLLGGAVDLQIGLLAAVGAAAEAGDIAAKALDIQQAGEQTAISIGQSGNFSGSNVAAKAGQTAANVLGSIAGGAAATALVGVLFGTGIGESVVAVAAAVLAGYALGKLAETAYQAETGTGLPPGYFNPLSEAASVATIKI